jgi:hypothetical protein
MRHGGPPLSTMMARQRRIDRAGNARCVYREICTSCATRGPQAANEELDMSTPPPDPTYLPIEPDPDELLDPDAPPPPDDPDSPDGPDSATPLVPADPNNGTPRL